MITYEATLAVVEDAERAIGAVLRNALPGLGVETRIVHAPRLGIVVEVGSETTHYPDVHIARIAGPLRLSDAGRDMHERAPNLLIAKLNGVMP